MTTPSSSFTILYFASANSYTGKLSERLSAPLPLSSLFKTLDKKYPGIEGKVLKSCAVTINLEYADIEVKNGETETIIQVDDEVGIIPPVSSG